MEKEQIVLALVRNAVCGKPLSAEIEAACTEEMLEDVYHFSHYHDLAHLAGHALEKLNLPKCEGLSQCRDAKKQAIFRYMRQQLDYEQICAVLEKAKIPYIPLKGAVLRQWYPEPWMRTSSDIDILVQEEQLETAVKQLQEAMQFTASEKGNHDVSMHSPNGVHLELHYRTIAKSEENTQKSSILPRMWEFATPVQPDRYCYEITDELFYFYHVSHMTKHFINGGCGIRAFLDLWIMKHRADCTADKAAALLTEGGMLAYARAAEKLTDVWFEEKPSDEMTDRLALCVLTGGVYGSVQNHVSLYQTQNGGRFSYALIRIFLPYDTIKYYYPILQKRKWLTPLFQVVRWCKILFCGGMKRASKEMKFIVTVPRKELKFTKELLEHLELKQ